MPLGELRVILAVHRQVLAVAPVQTALAVPRRDHVVDDAEIAGIPCDAYAGMTARGGGHPPWAAFEPHPRELAGAAPKIADQDRVGLCRPAGTEKSRAPR